MQVVIATCIRCDGRVSVATIEWVMAQQARWGARRLTWRSCAGGYLDAQRNWLIECHRTDCDAMLFLDDGVRPPADALERLLAVDAPIAAGLYPIEVDGLACWSIANADGYWPRLERLPAEPFGVDRARAGCLLVRTEVFERIGWPWFRTEIRHATRESPDLLARTDDESFCANCRQAGLAIRAHPEVLCEYPA